LETVDPQAEALGNFEVGKVLEHEFKGMAFTEIEAGGELIHKVAMGVTVGCGKAVGYLRVEIDGVDDPTLPEMRENAAALPEHPSGLLKGTDIGSQGRKTQPEDKVALLHEVVTHGLIACCFAPAEFAYQPAVTAYQFVQPVVFVSAPFAHSVVFYLYNNWFLWIIGHDGKIISKFSI